MLQSHYRRVLNAKPQVDTNSPVCLNRSIKRYDSTRRFQQAKSPSKQTKNLPRVTPSPTTLTTTHTVNNSRPTSSASSTANKIAWYLEALQQEAFPVYRPKLQHHQTHQTINVQTPTPISRPRRPLIENTSKSKLKSMREHYTPANLNNRSRRASKISLKTTDQFNKDKEVVTCYGQWLEEQAVLAQTRKQAAVLAHKQQQSSDSGNDTSLSNSKNSWTENDEIELIAEITEEILRLEMFSDRAIRQTAKFHLQKLSPENSDHLLRCLMRDLNIKDESPT